jgi:hypothetical protein
VSPIGDLARQDDYGLPDVGAPLIPSGPQVSPGTILGNRVADVLSRYPGHVMGSLAALPQRVFGASEQMRAGGGYNPAPAVEAALMTMGTGAVAGVPVRGGETALGAGIIRDPALWHGLSTVKLPRPLAEMTPTYKMGDLAAEKVISPADLQGGWLLPGLGDRSLAGGKLTGIGGDKLPVAVPLEGGHGFMPANVDTGAAWASERGPITVLANKTKRLAETGDPVYFPYTAMGERSVDFSHHVSDALSEMLKLKGPTKQAASAFDTRMKTADKDFAAVHNWPGVDSPYLDVYLRNQPGVVRNKFAKLMDTRQMQDLGLPSVAEARHAVTDPRLLDVPTGASGLSIAKLDPAGRVMTGPDVATPHSTYSTQLGGAYSGGFGTSVPKEIMYPDMIAAYTKLGYAPFRHDYLMARGVEGAPGAQKANQKWVDDVSRFIERGRVE